MRSGVRLPALISRQETAQGGPPGREGAPLSAPKRKPGPWGTSPPSSPRHSSPKDGSGCLPTPPRWCSFSKGSPAGVGDMLQRPVVSYANGRDIAITFGQDEEATSL